jgi:hypothetical protein
MILPSLYKILILYFKIKTQIKLIVELIFLIGLRLIFCNILIRLGFN